MSSPIDSIPTRDEVEAQMERIRGSLDFRLAPKRIEMLQHLVDKALENEEVKETTIGQALVSNWSSRNTPRPGHEDHEPPSNVRAMASLLRDRLTEYYGGCGANDPVLIEVLLGRGYKVVWSYRRKPSAIALLDRALLQMAQGLPESVDVAMNSFIAATEEEPTFGPAHIGAAESAVVMAVCCVREERLRSLAHWFDEHFKEDAPRPLRGITDFLTIARTHAIHAIRIDYQPSKAHIILGFLEACASRWEAADLHFRSAIQISEADASEHPLYAAYLLAIGEQQKAFDTLDAFLNNRQTCPFAFAIYALFLYVTRQDEGADDVLAHCRCNIDEHNWLARMLSPALMLRFVDRKTSFDNYFEDSWFRVAAQGELEQPAVAQAAASSYRDGLLALSSRLFSHDEAMRLRVDYRLMATNEADGPGLFAKVCAHIVLEEPDLAIHAMKSAKGEPWMMWAHLWPFLDPLRGHEDFKQLVNDTALPRGSRSFQPDSA